MPRLRASLANAFLLLVTLAGLYAVLEWGFLRLVSRVFPLEALWSFDEPDGIWPLLQSSKRGFIPSDYIALTGDSYAMGMGDAMVANNPVRRPRFHSAHDIQDLTGRDVISFGFPGSGSIRGAISNPGGGIEYLRKLVEADFPPPSWMVLYFYEGNDLTENWIYYERTFLVDHAAADYDEPAVFDRYVRDVALGRQHLYLAARHAGWKDRLFFASFVRRVWAERVQGRRLRRKRFPDELRPNLYIPGNRWHPRRNGQKTNGALLGGKPVSLPDNLQGPALDLTPEQLTHAVGTFSKALAWSRGYFPGTQFAVAYLPSVLSVYRLIGDAVEAQNYLSDTDTRFPASEVERRHTWIRDAVAAVCREQGVPFVDTTDDLREASGRRKLHGPRDWNHFNREGYRVLAESVVRQLPDLTR